MQRVVAAIIKDRDGNFLIGQRPNKGRYPSKWEFIGGKVEEGESDQEALIREVREETGAIVSVGDLLHVSIVPSKDGDPDLKVLMFKTYHITGPYLKYVHTDLKWISPFTIGNYDLVESNIEMAKLILPEICWDW